ncbi:VWA domain-containing protein [Williamsia sp.]|uniref:VWA domain-containing protein n=1 Tax=Williamsia sp. TaxID=1872085 RepID=UPI001A2AB7C7|nr:VWA domain-containing protein [Williamsia sp.]MBJ7288328.1 VWA domain-containing protein [Williamsia sp.]
MTDPQLSLVAALLDRSGSMQSIADDTRGGFDAFVAKEREADGRTVVTLAQFDNVYELVYENRPIADVPPLELLPRNATALYDAIGKLVTDVGVALAARPEHERPGSVTVVVMTDGHENSSREWTNSAVRALITQQERVYDWDFVFLGSNIDAVEVGADLGFDREKSMTYTSSPAGVAAAFESVSGYQGRKRKSRRAGTVPTGGFTTTERQRSRGE